MKNRKTLFSSKWSVSITLLGGLLFMGTPAHAVLFDFTTLGANNTSLSSPATHNGVTANAFYNPGGGFVSTDLWLRNQTNDHGLGVCSEGTSACTTGGGDTNELDNLGYNELIRLEKGAGGIWTELWVSSLDSGGSNSNESGILAWSNSADPNGSFAGSFAFDHNDLLTDSYLASSIEGNILALAQASGFDNTAKYLFFYNDSSNGTNNDFLVWKGTVVPEPATGVLLGTGLLALGWMGYLKKRKQA